MSDQDQIQEAEVVETPVADAPALEQPQESINIDLGTAFNLRLQEFDKKIAEAELAVAALKKDKISYIYDENVKQIVAAHRERTLKAQIEEETKRKLSEQK